MNQQPCPHRGGLGQLPFRRKYQLSDVWNAARTERNFDYVFWGHIALNIIGEWAIQMLGRLLVLFAVFLISSLIFTGFYFVLPNVTSPSGPWFYIHSVIGNYLFFLFIVLYFFSGSFVAYSIIFNYYYAVTTKPGSPQDYLLYQPLSQLPSNSLSPTHSVSPPKGANSSTNQKREGFSINSNNSNISISSGNSRIQEGGSSLATFSENSSYRICKKCNFPKPRRCHHCSVCNQCVL
jgi:hypothetical protein